eukprot:COSAG02_NODE_6930_length_3283_cov_2.564698_2_plen_157_part_00
MACSGSRFICPHGTAGCGLAGSRQCGALERKDGWLARLPPPEASAFRSHATLHAAAPSRAVKSDHLPSWGLYRYPCAPQRAHDRGNKTIARAATRSQTEPRRTVAIQNACPRMTGLHLTGFGQPDDSFVRNRKLALPGRSQNWLRPIQRGREITGN